MTIHFTEEEQKYIVKEPFNWHLSDDCPDKIKKTAEPKLKMLNKKQ